MRLTDSAQMLEPNSHERIEMNQILEHPFFVGAGFDFVSKSRESR